MPLSQSQTPSIQYAVVKALGWGLAVLAISAGAQWLVYDILLRDPGGLRVISPLIAASVTAGLGFRLQMRVRQQRLSELRRYEIIREMNHHIRNAMQVVSYQAYQDPEARDRMRDALNRIDWALRDVLPHVNDPTEDPSGASAVVIRQNQGNGGA